MFASSRVASVVGILLLLLVWSSPAYAHGGASITIHSDGRGSVWITAHWQDGHPINEPTQVTLTARASSSAFPSSAFPSSGGPSSVGSSSGGPSLVGPAMLRQTFDERGTQTYGGTLEPGSWRVAIDLAAPVDGHCQALVPVAAPPAEPMPLEVACLIPASAPSGGAASPSGGGSLGPLWFTLGGLAAVGAAVWVALVRRRRTTSS